MIELAGRTFEIPHPFVWEYADVRGEKIESWRPGVRHEQDPEDPYNGEGIRLADGVGKQFITVVSVHKPGRYPERVFYTREWQDPDGKKFGKHGLRMTTTAALRRRVSGYHYAYEIA